MTVIQAAEDAATGLDLEALLRPRRVAVVGANERREAFTGGTVVNLVRHGFEGDIYPVNPRRETVAELQAYPDLASLPSPIDLAVLVVRAEQIVTTLGEAVEAGARAAIVVSSGFGEGVADAAGQRRATELATFLEHHPIPILGPSTTGLVNLNDRFVPRAVINQLEPARVAAGPIALISQSGAANNAVFNRAQSHGVPIGLAVATGMQANLDVWGVASAALADPRIEVIAILVEQLGTPEDYEQVLRSAAAMGKPVVLLRTGRSEVGGQAIRTHTGSLAGNWTIEEEMLRALGVTIVHDLDQLWEVAEVARHWGRPAEPAPRLGVVSFSGGEGAMIADQAEDAGLTMAPVSAGFEQLVADQLELAGPANPFDPTGEALGRPENALAAIKGFVELNRFDVHLVALNAQEAPAAGGLIHRMLEDLRQTEARIAVSYWEIPGFSDGLVESLADFPGPALAGSHRAIAALRCWQQTRGIAQRAHAAATGISQLQIGTAAVDYWGARELLGTLGARFAPAALTADVETAKEAAEAIGYPVVMKANVPSTTHKAAAGLVRIGISDAAALTRHFNELKAHTDGIVVEKAVLSTASLILGTVHDAHIGSVVMVGSGGSAAEMLRDTAVCPVRVLTPHSARETLRRTGIGAFLAEREPAAFGQVAELMVTVGQAVEGLKLSVDLNPIVVSEGDIVALDARIDTEVDGVGD
jgi:acyl-CoA synthetase (NDP forming)